MLKIEKQRRKGIVATVKRYAVLPSELELFTLRHKVVKQIEQMRIKISEIAKARDTYGVVSLDANTRGFDDTLDEIVQSRRKISPHLGDDDEVIVGFDADKKLILDRLLDIDVKHRSVVSIVGMGGLGKTTLAKKVYNSSEIKTHFDTYTWISVSQDFRASELTNAIIMKVLGITRENLEKMVEDNDEDYPKKELKDFLKERRYLIVMDDIWTPQVWEQIKAVLPNAMNGSRVLITTRKMDVAKHANSRIPPYELPLLSHEQSWELFLRKAFPTSRDAKPSCPEELEVIAQDLLKRCGRLPLAVVVLGGLLSRKDPTSPVWQEVAESMNWESTEDGEVCLPILALSYNDLPNQYLKSCFLYIGSFPEDSEIKASDLIKLWIAEGFVREKESMEATAKDYLDELIQRCMIQVAKKSLTHERVSRIRIHDLLRDLCISEAKENGLFRIFSSSEYSNHTEHDVACRRLVLQGNSRSNSNYSVSKVRTILCFNIGPEMHGFKLLRVVHIEVNHESFPEEIVTLIHLRYLGFRGAFVSNLPSSMGNLQHLQTLDVRGTYIETLPKTLGEIQTMRHICTSKPVPVESLAVGSLRNLQTLKKVKAKGGWLERDLAKLSSLRELTIYGVSATQGKALCDSLQKLNCLVSLSLYEAGSIPTELFPSLSGHHHLRKLNLDGPLSQKQHFPDILGFPRNLTCLKLSASKLERDPMATLERLPSLAILELWGDSFVGKKMTSSAGGFPRLQRLVLGWLNNLESWIVDVGGMPNLTYLNIYGCKKLEMLPEGLEHAGFLRELVVRDMPVTFKERLREGGGDWHKIRHVPSINMA